MLPVFCTTIRKVTLLPMLTGPFVGSSKVFVTVTADSVTKTPAVEVLVTVTPFAVAEFVTLPTALAVKKTEMLVLSPGLKGPISVHINEFALMIFGTTLADWKVRFAAGKLSVSETFVRIVLPVFTT